MQGKIENRTVYNFKDKNGKLRKEITLYDVRYRYKDPATGKWKQTCKRGFYTKKEAESFLVKLNHEQNSGTYVVDSGLTVREYLKSWLVNYAEHHVRKTTLEGYANIITRHLIPYLGNYKLLTLQASNIDVMYKDLAKNGRADGKGGLSSRSIMYTHRVLTEALNHAVKQQILNRNPAISALNIPKIKKYNASIYSLNEIMELLQAVKGTFYEIPIALAGLCGLRRGECLALKEEDIDFTNKRINVNKQLQQIGNTFQLAPPKSTESNICISGPDIVFEIIQRHIDENHKKRDILGNSYNDEGWLVCSDDGRCKNPKTFSRAFSDMLRRKGFRHIRFHDLRHSCCSIYLASNVPLAVTSKLLGHSSINITANIYAHLMEESITDAGEKINEAIGNIHPKKE